MLTTNTTTNASPARLFAGEQQPDISEEDNGYCWPICELTRDERERSVPGVTYRQNPAYCNSQEIAKEIVRRYNAHNALLAACRHALAFIEHCHSHTDDGEPISEIDTIAQATDGGPEMECDLKSIRAAIAAAEKGARA